MLMDNPIFLTILTVIIAGGIFLLVRQVSHAVRTKEVGPRTLHMGIVLFCILIALLSWYTNSGYYRTVFKPTLILQALLLFYITYYTAECAESSKKIRVVMKLSYITYLVSNIFIPEKNDISAEAFFGLIHIDLILWIFAPIAILAFVCNLVSLLLQLAAGWKIRKNKS